MKYTFILLLTFLMISCQSNINLRITETTETATVVKGNRFEGVIFSETMELDTVYEKRFTPTVEEVELAETVLRNQWNKIEQDKRFKDFSRQYIGIIDKDGNKIILVNVLYKYVRPIAMCFAIIPLPFSKTRINKKALKNDWFFADNKNYESYMFGGFGDMARIEINLKNQNIMKLEYLPISFAYDKNGKPKLFPYGKQWYYDAYMDYMEADTSSLISY